MSNRNESITYAHAHAHAHLFCMRSSDMKIIFTFFFCRPKDLFIYFIDVHVNKGIDHWFEIIIHIL